MGLLSTDETIDYWDERHRLRGDFRSGGDMTFDEPTNRMFYVHRLGMLLDAIGHQASVVAPRFILDAGCGKGWFSRQLARFGHHVDAIDESERALLHCRERGGGVRYHRSSLADWSSPWLYDVVAAIDVMFHILDQDEWQRSVINLASLVRMAGQLILSDWGESGERVYGDYQVVRGPDRYLSLASACRLRLDSWRPYAFRGNPIGLYVFSRIG
jgi:SAM-dependent methyltransferase